MATGSGGDDVNPPQGAQFVARNVDFIQMNQSLGQRNARFYGAPQGVGLLKDFANQVMRKFAGLRHSVLSFQFSAFIQQLTEN
jgi:hypothetical protein